ncbi:MAG: DNA adenine methylase [Myxococcota bacterium]
MNATAKTPDVAPRRPKPFLKWAGGKGKLLPEITKRFPKAYRRYHEPFVGGAAVFFGLGPDTASLSDINDELVNAYRAIRDDVDSVIEELRAHEATEEHFYAVRGQEREGMAPAESTARTIFLNRTCFNGLYRVNRKGQFNVPFGRYANPKICDADNLRAVSAALQGVEIEHRSAFEIVKRAHKGDLVYFDPPYDPVSKTASFTSYTRHGFGDSEQEKLAQVCRDLDRKGVHFVLSNSDTEFIRSLYQGFRIEQVYVRRPINSRADRRGPVAEVLVSNPANATR